MRIAFDLDDTLIPGKIPFALEPKPRNLFRRFLCVEPLRFGTPDLFNELWSLGHEVCIYTTSFRGVYSTKLLFRGYHTRVGKVINVPIHKRKISRLGNAYKTCSKFPPAFGIDLLIDNCGGVANEAKRYNFEMLQVHPDDDRWIATIRSHIGLDG